MPIFGGECIRTALSVWVRTRMALGGETNSAGKSPHGRFAHAFGRAVVSSADASKRK